MWYGDSRVESKSGYDEVTRSNKSDDKRNQVIDTAASGRFPPPSPPQKYTPYSIQQAVNKLPLHPPPVYISRNILTCFCDGTCRTANQTSNSRSESSMRTVDSLSFYLPRPQPPHVNGPV